jgi:hypothetical protein
MTEQELADRFSNALTEIGEASIALVLAEREACARIIDEAIANEEGLEPLLRAIAQTIRGRPR